MSGLLEMELAPFKNRYFDQCGTVEEWWQEKPFEGFYLWPNPKQFFDVFPHEVHSNDAIIRIYDIIVSLVWKDSCRKNQLEMIN